MGNILVEDNINWAVYKQVDTFLQRQGFDLDICQRLALYAAKLNCKPKLAYLLCKARRLQARVKRQVVILPDDELTAAIEKRQDQNSDPILADYLAKERLEEALAEMDEELQEFVFNFAWREELLRWYPDDYDRLAQRLARWRKRHKEAGP